MSRDDVARARVSWKAAWKMMDGVMLFSFEKVLRVRLRGLVMEAVM